jgi:hypothetical protein
MLTFVYSSTCFGRFSAHNQELNDCSRSFWFYLRIVVIAVLCWWSGRPARIRTQHYYHHDTKVKPEVATAVIELLIMGGKTPETCWAVKNVRLINWKILHQVGDLFELNVKLRCQKVKIIHSLSSVFCNINNILSTISQIFLLFFREFIQHRPKLLKNL